MSEQNEPNQTVEVLTCIEQHGPITAQDIVEKTGWNRYVVDMVIKALRERDMIVQFDVTEKWLEPHYTVSSPKSARMTLEQAEQELRAIAAAFSTDLPGDMGFAERLLRVANFLAGIT